MPNKMKWKMIEDLKYMAAFQKECLDRGNWDDFDRLEAEIEKLARKIIGDD